MSLFRQPLRHDSTKSEQAVARYVASIRAHLEPDPLFERRLRGQVVNRFVAMRQASEGSTGRRQMGVVGRAVLYASVALAVSVGGTLAVSQDALPGDVLYPLKRQVERLRFQVLPAHLHDDLVAIELTVRLDELDRLTRSGRADDAGSLVREIHDDYAALVSIEPDTSSILASRLVVLEALVDRLPDQARAAVEEVIARVNDGNGRPVEPGSGRAPASPPAHGSSNGNAGTSGNDDAPASPGNAGGQSDASDGLGGGAPTDPGSASDRPKPAQPSPKPTKSPKVAE